MVYIFYHHHTITFRIFLDFFICYAVYSNYSFALFKSLELLVSRLKLTVPIVNTNSSVYLTIYELIDNQ